MKKKYIINTNLYEQVIRKTLDLNENYPLGAENDPTAPYNETDVEMHRDTNLKDNEIMFDNVASNDEFAIVKDKSTQKYYIVYLDEADEDFKQFIAAPSNFDGTDEDGDPIYTYDYENAEIDDKAIVSYASYLKFGNHYGVGLEAYEKGLMAEIDNELRDELISTFEKFKQYGKHRSYDIFINVLKNI